MNEKKVQCNEEVELKDEDKIKIMVTNSATVTFRLTKQRRMAKIANKQTQKPKQEVRIRVLCTKCIT